MVEYLPSMYELPITKKKKEEGKRKILEVSHLYSKITVTIWEVTVIFVVSFSLRFSKCYLE